MTELKEFKLPDVGEGLTEADIVAWHVKPGDQVEINQIIVEIETAKRVSNWLHKSGFARFRMPAAACTPAHRSRSAQTRDTVGNTVSPPYSTAGMRERRRSSIGIPDSLPAP